MRPALALAALLSLGAPLATAHEFWLEPEAYRIAEGAPVETPRWV